MGYKYIPGSTARGIDNSLKQNKQKTEHAKAEKEFKDTKVTELKEIKKSNEAKPKERKPRAKEYDIDEDYPRQKAIIKPEPEERVKMWFTIVVQGGKAKVVEKGDQLKCLEYIANHIHKGKDSDVDMFVASGVKLLGY